MAASIPDPLILELRERIDNGDAEALAGWLEERREASPDLVRQAIPWGPVGVEGGEQQDPHLSDPLHYVSDAVFHRLFRGDDPAAVARVLVKAGALIEGAGGRETPLHGAASLGQAGVAEVLLDAGADLEARAQYPGVPHGTPLGFAVEFGMVAVADLLVARGAWRGSLRLAAGTGDLESVEELWGQRGSEEPEVLDAFRCAVVGERLEVMSYFLQRGVDLHSLVRNSTVLHWAAWEGKAESAQWLLSRDAARRDPEHDSTPGGWALYRSERLGAGWGHARTVAVLARAELEARQLGDPD
ncbi:MAG: ankyrin repeat domain-containing protein [Acidobacteriota bacterium]